MEGRREKGGNEKGPEGQAQGHRRVLPNDNPPRCRGEQPRGSIEKLDQSWSLDQLFLLVRVNQLSLMYVGTAPVIAPFDGPRLNR